MFRFVLILTLALFANGHRPQKNQPLKKQHHRIVGGEATTIEKRPYQVGLLLTDNAGDNYMCGGSILSDRWILTAAHCTPNIREVTVRAGSVQFFFGGTAVKTSTILVHPRYDKNTFDYDIALLYLSSKPLPLNNSTIKAVTLTKENTPVPAGTHVTVSGWGKTSEGGEDADTLMEVTVETFSTETCKKSYKNFSIRQLCAGEPEGGKDSCQGDSGGPLVNSENVQVGIVSNGIGCARPGIPGVYSNVSALRPWIKLYTGI